MNSKSTNFISESPTFLGKLIRDQTIALCMYRPQRVVSVRRNFLDAQNIQI